MKSTQVLEDEGKFHMHFLDLEFLMNKKHAHRARFEATKRKRDRCSATKTTRRLRSMKIHESQARENFNIAYRANLRCKWCYFPDPILQQQLGPPWVHTPAQPPTINNPRLCADTNK